MPNIEFRDVDAETFEDDPEEYIRRDMEGSDVDTRRRGATDLVRGLCKYFEQEVIQIFSGYMAHLLGAAAAPGPWTYHAACPSPGVAWSGSCGTLSTDAPA